MVILTPKSTAQDKHRGLTGTATWEGSSQWEKKDYGNFKNTSVG